MNRRDRLPTGWRQPPETTAEPVPLRRPYLAPDAFPANLLQPPAPGTAVPPPPVAAAPAQSGDWTPPQPAAPGPPQPVNWVPPPTVDGAPPQAVNWAPPVPADPVAPRYPDWAPPPVNPGSAQPAAGAAPQPVTPGPPEPVNWAPPPLGPRPTQPVNPVPPPPTDWARPPVDAVPRQPPALRRWRPMRAILGEEYRAPVLWCEFGACIARYTRAEAVDERDLRTHALAAGWRYDAYGRLACPSCARNDSAFLRPA